MTHERGKLESCQRPATLPSSTVFTLGIANPGQFLGRQHTLFLPKQVEAADRTSVDTKFVLKNLQARTGSSVHNALFFTLQQIFYAKQNLAVLASSNAPMIKTH